MGNMETIEVNPSRRTNRIIELAWRLGVELNEQEAHAMDGRDFSRLR